MAELYFLPQFKQVNLIAPSGITAIQTSGIKLSDVDGIDTTKPGIICIDWSLALDTAVAEWITYTSIDANNELVGVTRGQEGFSAKTHASNAVVAFTYSKSHVNNLNDDFLVAHNTDGTHKSGSVFTLPQFNDASSNHKYILAVSELLADRTVTLPLLTGNDEFVFKDFTQTLTNKTLTSPVLGGTATGTYTLGGTPTVTSPVISGAGGTGGGRLGWDQDNLNLKVGDATANQIVHVSAWTAFTPSWGGITEGSGTNVGAYCILGKTCHFRAEFTFAANSSATGSFSLALPVTKATGYNGTYDSVVGNVILFDAGTGNFQGVITSLGSIVSLSVSGANVIRATVNATAPFTWTTGDVLTVTGTYEIA